MKTVLIVGGDFGEIPKKSSIIEKLSIGFNNVTIVNGGSVQDLIDIDLQGYKLILWMANVDNEIHKYYAKKDVGSILICSKVLRDNRNMGDAVARIFKMNANAVIAIESDVNPFVFNLVDALGNSWCKTSNLLELTNSIGDLYRWHEESIRVGTILNKEMLIDDSSDRERLEEFAEVVKLVADKVENERGGRYFGNASTRCAKMFPSYRFYRSRTSIFVSARNVPKDRMTVDDFVIVSLIDGKVNYNSKSKPSVDTPVQLELYNRYDINYMIHGHAYIDNAQFTDNYYPCGDLRELEEIEKCFDRGVFVINLKNHGFVIATETLEEMKEIVERTKFVYRTMEEKIMV